MQRINKAAAAIYGWDCPLLTFIYPGFDCGSFEDFVSGSRFSTSTPMGTLKKLTWREGKLALLVPRLWLKASPKTQCVAQSTNSSPSATRAALFYSSGPQKEILEKAVQLKRKITLPTEKAIELGPNGQM